MTDGYYINKTQVWITFEFEGIHCYPDALTNPELADVSFLGHPHRHMFNVKVTIDVNHDDRDIEFILLKRELVELFPSRSLDYKSCEMICNDIANHIKSKYPSRSFAIDVSEDGENGATATYNWVEY